jgi:hypothetical protein
MGCDQLLEVETPTRVPETLLDDPTLAPMLVQGAVADFECAFANYIVATALVTDELYSASTGAVNTWDLRSAYESGASLGCEPGSPINVGVYVALATARFQADDAFRRIEAFSESVVPPPGRDFLLATAAAYAGYAYALFGEGFCEAAFDQGPALDWRSVLAIAEDRFSAALAWADSADADSISYLAHIGRARVRLSLGRLPEAAADARAVPQSFMKHATYSSANDRRKNRVYQFNQFETVVSIDPRFRDLTVDGALDTRVAVTDAGRSGRDGLTPLWFQTKYPTESSPIVMASWDEAQLIVAEAEGGQEAVDRINALRAQTTPPLPLFSSSDLDSIADQVRMERQRELFLEGHRLNDVLRFGSQLDTVNHKGVTMGDLTCLRLPSVEIDNNPNIRGPRRTTRD